jgi:hypothetical protein
MRIASVVALVGSLAGACSYTSYTPPARMMPLETAVAPARGASDVQLDLATVGTPLGFSTNDAAMRVRGGVSDLVSISAEGGVISVEGLAAQPIDQHAYIGRVAAHVHQADRTPGPHIAFTAGVGGGASPVAGRWVSEDAAVILSGNGYWFVPFASLEGFASQPVDAPGFSYVDATDGSSHADQLTRTAGYRITAGFEIRDGHAADSAFGILVGFMMGGVYKANDNDAFAGLGVAFRLAI